MSEHADGSGRVLLFQCKLGPPDAQDLALEMDTYCVVTEDQACVYGGVIEVAMCDRGLRLVLDAQAARELDLDDSVVEVDLVVAAAAIEQLRGGLRRIFAYGRQDARPARLDV